MKRPHFPRFVQLAFLAGALITGTLPAAETAPVSLYDKDPAHLWNRVYSALMTRLPDPNAPVNDLLDPPYWSGTKHLLDGESNQQAVAVLGEFVKVPPSAMTAWQRAVMQRDLLGIHHWLLGRSLHNPGAAAATLTPPQKELAAALTRAVRHIALTSEEIGKLPDNYSTALAAPDAVTTFDAAKPAPFLPKDLLADDGPWISIERKAGDALAAPVHFLFFFNRSVFEVRFRHPEGRAAGEAYLKQLAATPNPWLKEKPANAVESSFQNASGWVNPETPQFPPGAMWALVRRALLADTKGNPVVSPMVESAQVRVYRTLKEQTPFEWEVSHALLLGKGGFHLTSMGDLELGLLLNGFGGGGERSLTHKDNGEAQGFCFACHSAPGIFSINSRAFVIPRDKEGPPVLRTASRKRVEEATLAKATASANWKALREQWDAPPPAPKEKPDEPKIDPPRIP